MRLGAVESGHRWPQKCLLGLMRLVPPGQPPDVIKTFMYRPEFFGKPFCDVAHELLRGESEWSAGERELFGAFTSKLNQCRF
jgi:hypothetical protein